MIMFRFVAEGDSERTGRGDRDAKLTGTSLGAVGGGWRAELSAICQILSWRQLPRELLEKALNCDGVCCPDALSDSSVFFVMFPSKD
jgi:hypothetical protein